MSNDLEAGGEQENAGGMPSRRRAPGRERTHCAVLLLPVDASMDFALAFETYLDGAGRVLGPFPVRGFRGQAGPRSASLQPFLLYEDGTIDYGAALGEARLHSCDIGKRTRLVQDETVGVCCEDGSEAIDYLVSELRPIRVTFP